MEDTKDEVADENKVSCCIKVSTMDDEERLAKVAEVLSNKNFSTFVKDNNVSDVTSEETEYLRKSEAAASSKHLKSKTS